MLTPGIEYFGAASDADAIAFGEGVLSTSPPLVRADGLTPHAQLALLGSLLTGLPVEQLVDPDSLEELSREDRGDAGIVVLRVPRPISEALAAASPGDLAEIARRAQALYFPQDEVDDLRALLEALAEAMRVGGGLYARAIIVTPSEKSRTPLPRSRWLIPWAGFGIAVALGAASFAIDAADPVRWVPRVAAALVFNVSFWTIVRLFRLRNLPMGRAGALTVTINPDDRFRVELAWAAREVLDLDVPLTERGRVFLSIDPSGLHVQIERGNSVTFPRPSILGSSPLSETVNRGPLDDPEWVDSIVFVLRSTDGEAISWSIRLLDLNGNPLDAAENAFVSQQIADLLGTSSGL